MIKALVIYQSLFGNTKKIALSLAGGLEEAGVTTDCLPIDEIDIERIHDYDFIAMGGPTHILGMSKQMKAFFETIAAVDLRGKMGFCFDTRNSSKMNKKSLFVLENSAARRIEGKMRGLKMRIIRKRESAIVAGREGPLLLKAEDLFFQIGRELAASLNTQLREIES